MDQHVHPGGCDPSATKGPDGPTIILARTATVYHEVVHTTRSHALIGESERGAVSMRVLPQRRRVGGTPSDIGKGGAFLGFSACCGERSTH